MDSNITLKNIYISGFWRSKREYSISNKQLTTLIFSIESSLNANKPKLFCVCQKLLYKYMFNKVLHRFNFNTHTCRIKKWLVFLLIYNKNYFVKTSKTHIIVSSRKFPGGNLTLKCNKQVTFWLKDKLFFGVVNKSYSLMNQLDVPSYLICFSYL